MPSRIRRKRRALRHRFGARMREIRADRELSQAALATAAGLSASVISRIESGRTEPNLTQAVLIMERLQIWTIDLMVPAGSPMPPRRRRVRLDDDLGDFYREHYE